jgi:WhiB family transcriptional regulator, redox-sensing transcriptional regulator
VSEIDQGGGAEKISIRAALGMQRGGKLTSWVHEAACAGQPLSMFYPDLGSRRSGENDVAISRARRICARCPVRRECLSEALTVETAVKPFGDYRLTRRLPAGIWGGWNETERWNDAVTHYDDCDRARCVGCRPITERLDLLGREAQIAVTTVPDKKGTSRVGRSKGVPKGRKLSPAQFPVVPEATFRGCSWTFEDSLASDLAEGFVVKLEVVVRLEELKAFHDGTRWVASILEVGRAYVRT